MADLKTFRDELRGLSPLQRDALLDLLVTWRNEAAGTGGVASALACGLNVLTFAVVDARTEAAQTKRLFDRMMAEAGTPADYFEPVSAFDR